jgi:hypothetical protein
MRGRHAGAGLVVIVSLLGACSDDDDGATEDRAPIVGFSATGEGTLTGAVEGSSPFEVHYPVTTRSCEAVVRATTFIIPLPPEVDEAALAWEAGVPELRGAGTYALDDLGTVRVTVRREGAGPVDYVSGDGTTGELVLHADGSGTFTFAGLVDATGATMGGTSTWTCGSEDEPPSGDG